jgi:hypothetical protein
MIDDDADLVAAYNEYLERFEALAGATEFGSFYKHKGRLIKKLRFHEFEPIYREYSQVAKVYLRSVDRGDTINDLVVKLIRDRAAELVKTSPV